MSHLMISYDPYFVHFKKHCMSCTSTANSNRLYSFQAVKLFNCLLHVFGVIFLSPKCNRSKWYHI